MVLPDQCRRKQRKGDPETEWSVMLHPSHSAWRSQRAPHLKSTARLVEEPLFAEFHHILTICPPYVGHMMPYVQIWFSIFAASSRWVAPVQSWTVRTPHMKRQVCTEGPQLDKISQDEFSLGHTSRPISQQNDSHAERVDGLMDVSVAGRTSRHSPARRHSMRAKDAQLDSHRLTRLWTMISCDELYSYI